MIKQPGAVIDSFGSHSPGFYSGTFSGECCWRSWLKIIWKAENSHCWIFNAYVRTGYLPTILCTGIRHSGSFSSGQHQPTSAWHCYHSADPWGPSQSPLPQPGACTCTIWSPFSDHKHRRRAKQSKKENNDSTTKDWPAQKYFWWASYLLNKITSIICILWFILDPFSQVLYLCRRVSVTFIHSGESNTAL